MSAHYLDIIDFELGVMIWVDFRNDRRDVVEYTVVLLLSTADGVETIRVYDAAHGLNEMHRYSKGGGKQPGIEIHRGNLGEGMRAAIEDIKRRYLAMIEGWEG